jgi:hypothetical protein
MAMRLRPPPTLPAVGIGYSVAAVVSVACGIAVTLAPVAALALLGIALVPLMVRAGAWSWALAALGSTVCARLLSETGLLHPAVVFMDFPLCVAAVATVLIRRRSSRSGGVLGLLLLLVGLVAALSGIHAGQPALRTLLDLWLFVQPWLLAWALTMDPPGAGQRRLLVGAFLGGALLQVPVVVWQARIHGISDSVQGTYIGNGAGSHVVGAYAILAALAAFGLAMRGRSWLWIVAGSTLLVVPVLSDAKQALFALPPAFLVLLLDRGRRTMLRSVSVVAALAIGGLYLSTINSTHIAVDLIERSTDSDRGTAAAWTLIWDRMQPSPPAMLIGLGPGQSVSRVALLSSEGIVEPDSPVVQLGFHTAPLTAQIVAGLGEEPSSFNSGVSSALGLWGDFGLLGLLSYSLLFVWAWRHLGRRGNDLAPAARAALLLSFMLGFVYSWWEQPPFTVPAAILVGVACTDPADA